MAKTIAEFKAAASKKLGQPSASFTGNQRSLDFTGLEKGDEFIIPEVFEVYTETFGKGDDAREAEFIYVEVRNVNEKGEVVKESVKPFYPSTFTKNREVYENTSKGQPLRSTGVRKHTEGSAAELFREYVEVQEGMHALSEQCKAGKKLRVTKMTDVLTQRYGTETLMTTKIPTIELI